MIAVNWLSPRDLIDTFGAAGLLLVIFLESGGRITAMSQMSCRIIG